MTNRDPPKGNDDHPTHPTQLMNAAVRELLKRKDQQAALNRSLPEAFRTANSENRRGGSVGQQVGVMRENIVRGYLQTQLGRQSVQAAGGANSRNDLCIEGSYIEIKTVTDKNLVKVTWTADPTRGKFYLDDYQPNADMILVRIQWGKNQNSVFHIPAETLLEIHGRMGEDSFRHASGTNNRGPDFSKEFMAEIERHGNVLAIPIDWGKDTKDETGLSRWLDYWNSKISG